jgi:cell pole-organizing protein PopZ
MKAETIVRDWHSRLPDHSSVEHLRVQSQTPPPAPKTAELRRAKCDCSLENLVRDLLHPLLKEWLDSNLAEIVEKCVNDEIKRMART